MMISISDVSCTFPGAEQPVLDHLDLEIGEGDFCAVVGGNGSGKTSLCKLLTGLIPHYCAGKIEGMIEVAGLIPSRTSVAEIAHRVGYVAQDFENQLLRPRVLEDVAFAPMNFGYPDHHDRARRALRVLGLEHLETRVIWELSGGEKHLVALAGAVALDPAVILVDEPVSQLDPLNAEAVYERLAALHRTGKTILVVEHCTEFIGRYCSTVAFMERGRIARHLPVRQALTLVDEMEAAELDPPAATQVAFRLGARPLPLTGPEAAPVLEPWARQARERKMDDDCPLELRGESAEPLIVVHGLSHEILGIDGRRRQILRDLRLRVGGGERVALVGANGSGKSTLLRILAGLIRATAGVVLVAGKDATRLPPEAVAESVALVYQNPQEMFIEDEVQKDVRYFMDQRGRADAEHRTRDLLSRFSLEELARRDGRLLSGGQMRRASLAIAISMDPHILLLDEPSSSLDAANRRQVVRMLSSLDGRGFCAVVATHDMELAASWANRIVALRDGMIAADCSPHEFFASPDLCRIAQVREPGCVELSRLLGLSPASLSVDALVNRLERKGGPGVVMEEEHVVSG